ncbi:hypothetical protein ISN45_Aa05g019020, partial [Arabidopsis thaliana x Arabidopsis arenosa]
MVGEDRGCGIFTPPIEEISVAVAMESEDSYCDYRRSMKKMVMCHFLSFGVYFRPKVYGVPVSLSCFA